MEKLNYTPSIRTRLLAIPLLVGCVSAVSAAEPEPQVSVKSFNQATELLSQKPGEKCNLTGVGAEVFVGAKIVSGQVQIIIAGPWGKGSMSCGIGDDKFSCENVPEAAGLNQRDIEQVFEQIPQRCVVDYV